MSEIPLNKVGFAVVINEHDLLGVTKLYWKFKLAERCAKKIIKNNSDMKVTIHSLYLDREPICEVKDAT